MGEHMTHDAMVTSPIQERGFLGKPHRGRGFLGEPPL